MKYRLQLLLSCSILDLEVRLHGVVEGAHEGGVVHRGSLPREAALVALVAVRQDVLALVLLPPLEDGRDVEAAAVVGLLGQLLHKVALEVDQVGRLLKAAQPAIKLKWMWVSGLVEV